MLNGSQINIQSAGNLHDVYKSFLVLQHVFIGVKWLVCPTWDLTVQVMDWYQKLTKYASFLLFISNKSRWREY